MIFIEEKKQQIINICIYLLEYFGGSFGGRVIDVLTLPKSTRTPKITMKIPCTVIKNKLSFPRNHVILARFGPPVFQNEHFSLMPV